MRLLLLLIIAGVAAYYTNPTREAHEAKARVALQSYQPPAAAASGNLIDNAISFVTGMAAGQGRYESYYVFSKYTLDMPGVQYLECYGAYTLVNCRVVEPGATG